MVYFDARLSEKWPTVEVRTADVALRVEDAVTLAGLVRGLVETAAREARAGTPPPDVRAEVLRVAAWRAGRSGLAGDLVHPLTGRPAPAADVLGALLDHVRPALADAGDEQRVDRRPGDACCAAAPAPTCSAACTGDRRPGRRRPRGRGRHRRRGRTRPPRRRRSRTG